MRSEGLLPVHGFVLAGGKSSRMGVDKATLEFRGRPMVEIAVEKLRGFCADVSICGNRDDLAGYAPVVRDARVDCGPAAGIEAGLLAARQEWCLFVPVDVPLVPGCLLRQFAEWVIGFDEQPDSAIFGPFAGSYLYTRERRQPSFCILRPHCAELIGRELDKGTRSVERLLERIPEEFGGASFVPSGALQFALHGMTAEQVEVAFGNLNTPDEFDMAELWSESLAE